MTKEEVLQLFDQAIEAQNQFDLAKLASNNFKDVEEPKLPKIIYDLDELDEFAQRLERYKEMKTKVAENYTTAGRAWTEISHKIMNFLPSQVWVKHGIYAIGVAYDTWGGPSNYLDIRPWSEDLPSLDRSYRGD